MVGKLLGGRYEIERRIGEGSVGVVYQARDRQAQKSVAIKVLDTALSEIGASTWAQRFRTGARAAAQLRSPHATLVLDFGEAPEGLYLVMELLSGRSVKEELARIGKLPPRRVLNILGQVATALVEAHGLGIIHRNLSPENIFLTERGGSDFVKLLDYTIAKMDTPGGQAATAAGTAVGNPLYMSPEHIRGAAVTPRSDLYTLGAVTFEMLTGQPPFSGQTSLELFAQHIGQPPPAMRGIPDGIARLVLRLLSKDPQQRPESADALLGEAAVLLAPPAPAPAPPHAPAVQHAPPFVVAAADQQTLTGSDQLGAPPPPVAQGIGMGAPATLRLQSVRRVTQPDGDIAHSAPLAPSAELLEPGQLLGNYQIIRKLGQGGMGAVFEAVHTKISRRVAIKLLHVHLSSRPEFASRFVNEARSVNLIPDQGLVQISDYGQMPNGAPYIVMEFLEGETLGKRIERMGGRLPVEDVIRLGGQVAASLAAAHKSNITHRDLKPDNVMIVPDTHMPGGERTKLLDFGIAKIAEGVEPEQLRTATGVVIGTPIYMSPEQCRGDSDLNPQSAVYSLGVMLFAMLVGQPPFSGTGMGDIMGKHIHVPPPSLRSLSPSVPSKLSALIDRMLAKERAQRPSMAEVADILGARKRSQDSLAPLDSSPVGWERSQGSFTVRKRHLPLMLLALAVALGGVVLGTRAVLRKQEAPPNSQTTVDPALAAKRATSQEAPPAVPSAPAVAPPAAPAETATPPVLKPSSSPKNTRPISAPTPPPRPPGPRAKKPPIQFVKE